MNKEIFNIITIQFGLHVVLAAMIGLDKILDINSACLIINRLEKNIKSKFPEVKWSFIEMDIKC